MNSKRFAGHARNGRAAVYLLTGLACGVATSAFAQDQGAQKVEEVDEIVVTGSRIARGVEDASTPLAIIDADEIKLSGATSIDKVLNDQPQFVAATNGGRRYEKSSCPGRWARSISVTTCSKSDRDTAQQPMC